MTYIRLWVFGGTVVGSNPTTPNIIIIFKGGSLVKVQQSRYNKLRLNKMSIKELDDYCIINDICVVVEHGRFKKFEHEFKTY
jgi:hypothetical protein